MRPYVSRLSVNGFSVKRVSVNEVSVDAPNESVLGVSEATYSALHGYRTVPEPGF